MIALQISCMHRYANMNSRANVVDVNMSMTEKANQMKYSPISSMVGYLNKRRCSKEEGIPRN